jgi:hypothetical protein
VSSRPTLLVVSAFSESLRYDGLSMVRTQGIYRGRNTQQKLVMIVIQQTSVVVVSNLPLYFLRRDMLMEVLLVATMMMRLGIWETATLRVEKQTFITKG